MRGQLMHTHACVSNGARHTTHPQMQSDSNQDTAACSQIEHQHSRLITSQDWPGRTHHITADNNPLLVTFMSCRTQP